MIGRNIRAIRKEKAKISINKLSELSGVSLGYISDLENDKFTNPTIDKLSKIAIALGVKVDDFFNGIEKYKHLGIKIKYLREKLGLSIEDLALKSDVSVTTFQDIENGIKKPSTSLLVRISVLLYVAWDTITDDVEEYSQDIEEVTFEFNNPGHSNEPISPEEMRYIENLAMERYKKYTPTITVKEQEKLEAQAKDIVDEFAISLAQNKDMLDDNDYLVLQASINSALQAITLKNKEKYTTNKNKRKK